jgi:hypothetical protein
VYSLFCPDHLLEKGGDIDKAFTLYTSNWDTSKIQKFKEYLDTAQIEPKYKTKFWVGIQKDSYKSVFRIHCKIQKKTGNKSIAYLQGNVKLFLLFKNQYRNFRRNHSSQRIYNFSSRGLDEYFKTTIVSRFIESPQKVSPRFPNSYTELRTYISLYMSRKFKWI